MRRPNAAKSNSARLDLVPVAEFQLITETIRRFRTGYVAEFGAATPDDLLYEAVSEGRRYPGMEHWLPLFHDKLETLFDYLPGTPLSRSNISPKTRRMSVFHKSPTTTMRAAMPLKQGVTPSTSRCRRNGSILPSRNGKTRLDAVRAGAAHAICGAGRECNRCRVRGAGTISRPSAPSQAQTSSRR